MISMSRCGCGSKPVPGATRSSFQTRKGPTPMRAGSWYSPKLKWWRAFSQSISNRPRLSNGRISTVICFSQYLAWSGGELGRDARHVLALETGHAELVLGRLARAVAGRDRAGAVGRSAGDLVQRPLRRAGIGQADDHHAVVEQGGVEGEDRRLLAAMLRGAAGEHAADLADQTVGNPNAAGAVEKGAHRRRHVAEPGRRAEDDR